MSIELNNYIEETLATTITEITGSRPQETKPIIFRNEASLTWWLTKKHGVELEKVEAMIIAAKPYLENCLGVQIRETHNRLGEILLCFHGAEGDFRDTSVTVINLEHFGKGPMLDVPHLGYKIQGAAIVSGELNPDVISALPPNQAPSNSLQHQTDLGVNLMIAPLAEKMKVGISAYATKSMMLVNYNRYEEKEKISDTNGTINRKSYRGEAIYKKEEGPSQNLSKILRKGHELALSAAGAAHAADIKARGKDTLHKVIELHSCSIFDHSVLEAIHHGARGALTNPEITSDDEQKQICIALKNDLKELINNNKKLNQETSLKEALEVLADELSPELFKIAVRPLALSLLDISPENPAPDCYWQFLPEEAEEFNKMVENALNQKESPLPLLQPLLDEIKNQTKLGKKLEICRNDIYGAGGGILARLEKVKEITANALDCEREELSAKRWLQGVAEVIREGLTKNTALGGVTSVEDFLKNCQFMGETLAKAFTHLFQITEKRLQIKKETPNNK